MQLLTLLDLVGLLDNLLTLGQDELDVAGVRHVGVDLIIMLVARRYLLRKRNG